MKVAAVRSSPSPLFAGIDAAIRRQRNAPASPPTDAHVSLGLLVAYESMSWCSAPEPAPKKSYAVSAPPERPPMPERAQVPVLPELPQVPLLTSTLKCHSS